MSFDLQVLVHGTEVGRLSRDRQGRTWFVPDLEWLGNGQVPPLGLAFLQDARARLAGTGLPAWFENLLPARGGALRAAICAERGLRDTDSAGLLLALGRDLPGAVEVVGTAAEAVREAPAGDMRISFSLAGMQLKFSMTEAGGRFTLPVRGQDGAWIVKLPGERFTELRAVESATMVWARAAGLPVPETRIVPTDSIEGLSASLRRQVPAAFAIRRYDRLPGFRRVHQEDFAQALEIDPEHLYGDTGPRRTGLDLLLALVGDACGEPARDELIDRVAFVVASGNGDAHLKNWSFLWDAPGRPRLAPCYDQVATITWPGFGWDLPSGPTLALSLGRSKRLDNLDGDRVATFAERGRAPGGVERFMAMLDRIHGAAAEGLADAPETLRAALTEHWARVPVLRARKKLKFS